ncbi:MAG: hypothetical protein NTX87_14495 [Planctomycetota bacterium]|nr:hypothetical protein [Planctomycetota bacterium]
MKKQTVIILVIAGAVLAVLGVIAVVGIALVAWLFLDYRRSEPMPAPPATAVMPDTSSPAETIPPMAVPMPPWPPATENVPPGAPVPAPPWPPAEPVPLTPGGPPPGGKVLPPDVKAPPFGVKTPPPPEAGTPPQTPAAVDTSAWQRHTDPLGFTVQHPAGWKAEATDDGVILIRSPDRKTSDPPDINVVPLAEW